MRSVEEMAQPMEMNMSGSGEAAPSAGRSNKRPPSRLQKQAPALLRLEECAGAAPGAGPVWGAGGRVPIPLLSPLVVSPTATPTPVWEAADQARTEGDVEGRGGGSGSGEQLQHDAPAASTGTGWLHPALPTPLAEPVSLVPLLQSQCSVEVRGAQQ